MDFNFPQREGTGIDKLVPHISLEAREIIQMMLVYDPEERPSSRQILKHAYFKDLRENDKRIHRAAVALSPSQATKKSEEEQSTQEGSGGQFQSSSKKIKNNSSLPLQPQKLPDIKHSEGKDQTKQEDENSDQDTNLPPIKANYAQKNYNVYQTQQQSKKNQPKQNKYPTIKPNVSGVSGVSIHKPYQYKNYTKKYVSPYGQKVVYKQ